MLLAHGVAVVALSRFMRSQPSRDRRWIGWLIAAGATAVAMAPLAILGSGQTGQVAWLPLTTWSTLPAYLGRLAGVGIVAGIVIGLGLAGFGRFRDHTAAWVLVTMSLVPLAALYLVGAVEPLFHHRYVLFIAAIWTVLAAIGMAQVPRPAAVAVLATIVVFSATAHVDLRRPDGHSDGGLDQMASHIVTHQRPGDAIVAENAGWLRLVLDYYLPADHRPQDIYLVTSPADRGSYLGAECVQPATCLGATTRVWVVCLSERPDPLDCLGTARAAPLREAYAPEPSSRFGVFSLTLYVRSTA
jgi:mannosyltransferase